MLYSEEIVVQNQEEMPPIDGEQEQPEIVGAAQVNNLENEQPQDGNVQIESREKIPLPVEDPNKDNGSVSTNEQELLESETHSDQGAKGNVANHDE